MRYFLKKRMNMKKIKLNISIIFGLILLLNSCQSARDGLTRGKKDNTDEFLVEKKNPLVLPPEFEKLPEPTNNKSKKKDDSKDIEKLIGSSNDTKSANKDSNENNSLERSILKVLSDD